MIIRPSEIERHNLPLSVSGSAGTAGCYARSARLAKATAGKASEGVLTAGHVVAGLPLGYQVTVGSMPGQQGYLSDVAPECIDAAFISVPWPRPSPKRLPIQSPIVVGDPAEFHGIHSTVTGAFVTTIMSHPAYLGAAMPQLVFLDRVGVKGDSGALVRSPSNEGMGMYLGLIRPQTSPNEAMCLNLHQIEYVLNLSLFH